MPTLPRPHVQIHTLWLFVEGHGHMHVCITLQSPNPDSSAGCEEMLLGFFDAWLVGKALSHLGMLVSTNMPRWPSSFALQHLLDDQLLQQAWEKAASVALHHTVHCPEPALQGLKVALEGVRKGHCSDLSQELPTVCQGQYADGRPCTASAKKHGYCLRHQKQASTPPSVKPVLSRLYEQVSRGLSQRFSVLLQKHSCSCCWRCC